MEFQKYLNEWENLIRRDRQAGEAYYYEHIFPVVIDRFLLRSDSLKKYRYLISLLGFSPQPIILFLRATKPDKVLFIHSEETEEYLDLIQQWTGLKISQVIKESVGSSDPTGVYKAIKDFVFSKDKNEILLDITGGKKSMVGGAAMAGSLLGIDIGYVDYEKYLSTLRQPEPGSEYPNILKNPLQVFGDIDFQKAKEAFNHYDFARCLDILAELDKRVEDIWGVRKLMDLAKIYQKINTFHFEEAKAMIDNLLIKCPDDNRFVPGKSIQTARDIVTILRDKKHPDHSLYSCLNYYFSGERFAERGRFDIAVFLMYRTIEIILSVALQEIGIHPSQPVYPSWVTPDGYIEKLKHVFEADYYEKRLPSKVGLMDSAIFLSMKKSPIVEELNLKELKGVITVRNDSHFTHGSRALGEEDFRKIRRIARKLLEKYLSIKSSRMVKDFESMFSFPKI